MSSSIKVEAVAFLRLYKQCVESHPEVSNGILLGYHDLSTNEIIVSNIVPLMPDSADPEPESVDFASESLKSLEAVNCDSEQVGVFFAGNVGACLSEAALKKIHAVQVSNPNAIAITFDNAAFKAVRSDPRAFRLSSSLMSFFSSFGKTSLAVEDALVQELPLELVSGPLVESMLVDSSAWIRANAKPTARAQQYVERGLEQLGRLIDDKKARKSLEACMQASTAQSLKQEVVKGARTVLGLVAL